MRSVRRRCKRQFGARLTADWHSRQHRLRRLLAEFIGTFGFTFLLSGGAAVLAKYGGANLAKFEYALILSMISALWLVVAVYFLGDISAHFNPAMTLAFTLRGDMGWPMAFAYFVVQFVAACAGSLLARAYFGVGGTGLRRFHRPVKSGRRCGFEAIITCGLVLMVLSMANGPKLNGAYVPLAVGAFVMSIGSMGGPYDGAAFNPARASRRISRSAISRPTGSICSARSSAQSSRCSSHASFAGLQKRKQAQAAQGVPLQASSG